MCFVAPKNTSILYVRMSKIDSTLAARELTGRDEAWKYERGEVLDHQASYMVCTKEPNHPRVIFIEICTKESIREEL